MFLLIQSVVKIVMIAAIAFKFHYVSINSAIAYYETEKEATLNSIMFLLILHRNNAHKTVYVDFKFHYVSINSLKQK